MASNILCFTNSSGERNPPTFKTRNSSITMAFSIVPPCASPIDRSISTSVTNPNVRARDTASSYVSREKSTVAFCTVLSIAGCPKLMPNCSTNPL